MKRVEEVGIEKFPSYGSEQEAEARYQEMHKFMEMDTQTYKLGRTQRRLQ
jgi:hypothetical protein